MSEDQAVSGDDRLVAITEGEWAGWSTWMTDAFEQSSGPFYERTMPDGQASGKKSSTSRTAEALATATSESLGVTKASSSPSTSKPPPPPSPSASSSSDENDRKSIILLSDCFLR